MIEHICTSVESFNALFLIVFAKNEPNSIIFNNRYFKFSLTVKLLANQDFQKIIYPIYERHFLYVFWRKRNYASAYNESLLSYVNCKE